MSKHLVKVATAGCITRFRNGVQFTKTPKEIMVDDSELAVLQADSYLCVDVLSHDAQNTGNGADDENAIANTVLDTTNIAVAPDATTERITITPDMASDDGTIVADTANATADASADTVALDAATANDSKIPGVSHDANDDLKIIAESLLHLDLDVNAGKPTVKELKDLGVELTAKQRDVAWDAYLIAQNNKNDV